MNGTLIDHNSILACGTLDSASSHFNHLTLRDLTAPNTMHACPVFSKLSQSVFP